MAMIHYHGQGETHIENEEGVRDRGLSKHLSSLAGSAMQTPLKHRA